jgi:hypothetical protein
MALSNSYEGTPHILATDFNPLKIKPTQHLNSVGMTHIKKKLVTFQPILSQTIKNQ